VTGERVYSGVIHVRTNRTLGPPIADVLAAARRCGVDFIVLTDIADPGEARELRGWQDGVLVLIAEELRCDDGQFLACDARRAVGHLPLLEPALAKTWQEGGAVAGLHYEFENGASKRSIRPAVPLERVDMFALWSFFDDYLLNVGGKAALQFLARPDRVLKGPARSLVRRWDAELARRNLPAVGTVNAMLRKDPLLDWREIMPYEVAFNTVRTAVLCDELPEDGRLASRMVWRSLRTGRSWIYNFAVGDAREAGFAFVSAKGDIVTLGDHWNGVARHGTMEVTLPVAAEVVLRRNGDPLFWGGAQDLMFPAPGPGVYRIEARVDGRPWLFTNCIRVGPGVGGPSAGTVADFT